MDALDKQPDFVLALSSGGSTMFRMSEREQREEIGALVEQYSELKGALARVDERLHRTEEAFLLVGQNWQTLHGIDGRVVVQPALPMSGDVGALMDEPQLAEVLNERDRLDRKVKAATKRLKEL